MPALALDTTYAPTDANRRAATAAIADRHVEEMATTPGHVAVAVRDHPPDAMALRWRSPSTPASR